MKTKFKMLALSASLLACGIGVTSQAQANAYAVSYLNVFNGTAIQDPFGSANFFFPNTTTSQASASLTGFAPLNNVAPKDAAPANLGAVAKANNDFTVQGQIGTYARGDAQIVSEQSPIPGSSVQVMSIAEGNIAFGGVGTGLGRNSSDTSFSIPFLVAGPTTLTFSFSADPFMKVFLDGPPQQFPSSVRAEINTNIIITDINGNTVFEWSSDGQIGGITGGVEVSDPFDLNRVIARNYITPGTTYYDPTACGEGLELVCGGNIDVGDLTPATSAFYQVMTNPIGNGTYTFTLTGRTNIDVQRVPEPATMALVGLGLLGLGFSRRKQA